MSFDPKIRGAASPVRVPTAQPRTEAPQEQAAPERPAGWTPASGFEATRGPKESLGRSRRGGVVDDSVGRSTGRGTQDDSVGRSTRRGTQDDSVGRSTRRGTQDDSVGRSTRRGTQDDSVGRSTRRGTQDDSVGRSTRRGTQDDSVGRSTRRGTQDDSIGRSTRRGTQDDSIGRRSVRGTQDDSIGRRSVRGTQDDSIGRAERDALVGPATGADQLALREALYARLETPSYLRDAATANVHEAVLKHVRTTALSGTQRAQLEAVLKACSAEGARLLGAIVEQSADFLNAVDAAGKTTLANLAELATQPLHARLASDTSKQDLLVSVLRDITNPNRIDQGDAPTCTVTSMQFELVADEPSEYVRLLTGLTGPQGKVTMRGGGELQLDHGDAGALDGRPVSQALFQTAAMEFANGRDMEFDPYAGKSLNARTGAEQRGLKPTQQTTVLRNLFGVTYASKNFRTEADGAKALEKLRAYDARGHQNRPVVLHLDQGPINHAVTLERVEGQRVLFRDPYGVLRSMPEAHFAKYVVAINAPKDLGVA